MLIKDFCRLHKISRRDLYRIKEIHDITFERDGNGNVQLTPEQCNVIVRLYTQGLTSKQPRYFTNSLGAFNIHDALRKVLDELNITECTLQFKEGYRFTLLNKTEEQRKLLVELYLEYKEADYHRRKFILDTLDKEF